jgi:hypothetical protein
MSKSRILLAAAVLTKINDAFQKGDAGELLLTCPFDGETMYDIYDDATWSVVVNDEPAIPGSQNSDLSSLDEAKQRVAELIADKLLAAKSMLTAAQEHGIQFVWMATETPERTSNV